MTPPPSVRWSHVGLNCRDQRKTEEFYTRWFGFRRSRVVEEDGVRVVFLRCGDVYLELFATHADPAFVAHDDGPQHPGTVRHIAFQVEDVDAFLAKVNGSVPISLGPVTFGRFIPGWKTVWLADPDDVVVEVSQGYLDQDSDELEKFP